MKRKIVMTLVALILLLGLMAIPAQAVTPEEIGDSIDAGIAWLVSVQNDNGSWGPDNTDRFGTTGLILVKLQDRAFELGFDGPFDDDYPLKANVVDGLNYLLPYASTVTITDQIAGDPDTDNDGLGVYVNNRVYDTAILMMAIAAGRDPAQTVASGPLATWTYGDVLQDLADWMAYAQTDTLDGQGGWYYSAVNGWGSADQSNAGYAMLGILYAQAPLYGYNCDIPDFVKSELNVFIDNIQCDIHGGSVYIVNDPRGIDYWENSLKTGNLLTQMAFYGDDTSVVRVQDALGYIGTHWSDNWTQGWGKTGNVQYQATYCLMKGFETMGVPLDGVPGVADWYQDFADEIVADQNPDGSWPANNPAYVWPHGALGHLVSAELGTAWALLTLERFAPPPPVVEVPLDIKPTSCPNPLNTKSKGVLPVAILGSDELDVTTIDPVSVALEGVAPLRWSYEDVAAPYTGGFSDPLDREDCWTEGPDGYTDLTLKYDTQEIVAALGAVSDGDVLLLTLTGKLLDDTDIAGADVVWIKMKGK